MHKKTIYTKPLAVPDKHLTTATEQLFLSESAKLYKNVYDALSKQYPRKVRENTDHKND